MKVMGYNIQSPCALLQPFMLALLVFFLSGKADFVGALVTTGAWFQLINSCNLWITGWLYFWNSRVGASLWNRLPWRWQMASFPLYQLYRAAVASGVEM